MKNSHYISVDGVLYNKDQTKLLKYPSKKPGTSYTIPNTVTSMNSRVFMECQNLTTINLSSSLTTIGWGTFVDCKNLTSVILPQDLTSIPNNAFEGCEKLTSVNIPVGVATIGEKSFSNCKSLTTLQLPTALTSIGKEAFYRCESLTAIHLPEKIKSIEEKTFSECKKLTSIDFSTGLTSIGKEAFYRCESLITVTIPEGIINIQERTFSECKNLTNVKLPEKLTSIGEMTFSSCKNLISIEFPQTLTTIERGAFSGCDKLSVVNLPKGVETIGNQAFLGYGLTAINVDEQNEHFCSVNGVLYNKEKTVLLRYPKNKPETTFVVPDGVESVQNGAFGGIQKLSRIEFPESVTSIGDSAFSNSVIAEVLLPKSLVSIGKSAFYGCFYLEVIEIPKEVTYIGEMAFEDYGNRRILYCYRDSEAHTYAERENIPYVFLSEITGLPEEPSDPPTGDTGDTLPSDPPTGDIGDTEGSLPSNPDDSGNTSQGNSSVNKPENSNTDLSNKPSMNPSDKPSTGVFGNNQTIQSIQNAIIILSNTEYIYDGKEKKPSVLVECNGKMLKEQNDYVVTYSKNKNIGTATITILGKNNYTGAVSKNFKISVRRGSFYTVGANKYEIMDGLTASFIGIKNSNSKKVVVPKVVKIGGKNFKVTSIGEKALFKNGKITSVRIGKM